MSRAYCYVFGHDDEVWLVGLRRRYHCRHCGMSAPEHMQTLPPSPALSPIPSDLAERVHDAAVAGLNVFAASLLNALRGQEEDPYAHLRPNGVDSWRVS